MRQGLLAGIAAEVLIVVALAAASEVGAQELPAFRLGAWDFQAGLGFDALSQQIRNEGAPNSNYSLNRFHELLGLETRGFAVKDPRLITGDLGLTFDMYQERDNNNGITDSRHGTLTGYNFDSTFFAEKPYTATVYANRNQAFTTLPFGGTSQFTAENAGATVRLREDSFVRDWGLPYFSASLTAYRQHFNETTLTTGAPFRRDTILNVAGAQAHNAFETADLDVRYEYDDLTDRVFPRDSYVTQTAGVNYSLDFGPDLNRRWDSRLFYYRRTGFTPLTTLTADEEIHIDHYDNLFTDYRYYFVRNEQVIGTDTIQIGTFRVQHQIYPNVTTKAEVQGSQQTVPAGTLDYYAGQLDENYRRSLPFNGQLTARAGGRYQVNENHLSAAQIDVVDEPHVAPTPIGGGAGFILAHDFVIVASIVMVDTQGGARQPTAAGVDYEVVVEGNRIRLIALASSTVIRAGDSLAVSYAYAVPPQLKYSTASWWLGATVDFQWIALSYDHDQADQTALSGDVGARLLQDWRRDQGGLELRAVWGRLQAQAGFGFQRYDSTFLSYTERAFVQTATYQPGYNLVLGLNASETHTDYTLPVRQTDTLSAISTLDWNAPSGWTVTAFGRTRRLRDSQVPTQITSEAGLVARFVYGKLEFTSLLAATSATQSTSHSIGERVELRAIRHF